MHGHMNIKFKYQALCDDRYNGLHVGFWLQITLEMLLASEILQCSIL